MSDKKTQIGFRVTDAMRKQIEAECIKRDLSMQEFLTAAVEHFSQTPAESEPVYFVLGDAEPEEHTRERRRWADLWAKFMRTMPRPKILLMAETMKLDLRHYKSSRRKARKERES